jgi:hypothetical protein
MDMTPIFTQLSMERAPEWYQPVPLEEINVRGQKGYKLAGNLREIWNLPTPPWLVKSKE